MKTYALAFTAALTAASFVTPSQAQSRNRPIESAPRSQPSEAARSDRGTVLSVTPIVEQVPVARRVCQDEPVTTRRQGSGAGAVVGAIAGAVIGNAIGGGSGRAAATALGFVGGAALGDHAEAQERAAEERSVRRCTTENVYESRTGSYNVVYEYGGREYSTVMRRDPGRYVQVQVQAMHDGGYDDAPPPRAARREAPVYVERPQRIYRSAPEPVYESYPDDYRSDDRYNYRYDYGPALGTGLVVGALIGYGLHYHGHRHYHYRGWRR